MPVFFSVQSFVHSNIFKNSGYRKNIHGNQIVLHFYCPSLCAQASYIFLYYQLADRSPGRYVGSSAKNQCISDALFRNPITGMLNK